MSLIRPVKLTVVKANNCEKLLFEITSHRSILPLVVLNQLSTTLMELMGAYEGSSEEARYQAYIPIDSAVMGKSNRYEIRLRLPFKTLEFGERLDEVFWGLYDGMVHSLSEGYGVDIYRKGEK